METVEQVKPVNFRRMWFDYVREVRSSHNKKRKNKNNQLSHKSAMTLASNSWGVKKQKLQRKMAKSTVREVEVPSTKIVV